MSKRMNGEGMIRQRKDGRFELRILVGYQENGKQKVNHSQEIPEYSKEYVFNIGTTINAKVFVIDDKTHSTMLLAEEY